MDNRDTKAEYDWDGYYRNLAETLRRQNSKLLDELADTDRRIEQLQSTNFLKGVRKLKKLLGRGEVPAGEQVPAAGQNPAEAPTPGAAAPQVPKDLTPYARAVRDLRCPETVYVREKEQALSELPPERAIFRVMKAEELPALYAFLAGEAQQAPDAADWEYAVITAADGFLSRYALRALDAFLREREEAQLLYGDEACVPFGCAEGEAPEAAFSPWLKSEWAPETFRNTFYFGSLAVLRRDLLQELTLHAEGDGLAMLYDLCLQAAHLLRTDGRPEENPKIGHVKELLFYRFAASDGEADAWMPGCGAAYAALRERALRAEGREGHLACGQDRDLLQVSYDLPADTKVSAVILSKDHPGVLKTCVQSLAERADGPALQILVIDNGSNASNRKLNEQLAAEYGFAYFYEPMEFNFSALCNIGYRHAEGDLILFLNDDTELLQKDALRRMAGLALQEDIGAVGAKLLYAGTDRIQHAGVTILRNGPSHKLTGFGDDRCYYHGMNRLDRNTLAVTAACMMVSRRSLERAGAAADGSFPFDESFRVAYNDVELCLRLDRAGLQNVQCNEAILAHYESLTRGVDAVDDAKWERLAGEGERLWNLYPAYRRHDPYYHSELADHALGYYPQRALPWEDLTVCAQVRKVSPADPVLKRSGSGRLRFHVDAAGWTHAPFPGAEDSCYVSGWAFFRGRGYAERSCAVLFRSEAGELYAATAVRQLREDLAGAFPREREIAADGFFLRISAAALPAGSYEIGLSVEEKASGLRSIAWQKDVRLEVPVR